MFPFSDSYVYSFFVLSLFSNFPVNTLLFSFFSERVLRGIMFFVILFLYLFFFTNLTCIHFYVHCSYVNLRFQLFYRFLRSHLPSPFLYLFVVQLAFAIVTIRYQPRFTFYIGKLWLMQWAFLHRTLPGSVALFKLLYFASYVVLRSSSGSEGFLSSAFYFEVSLAPASGICVYFLLFFPACHVPAPVVCFWILPSTAYFSNKQMSVSFTLCYELFWARSQWLAFLLSYGWLCQLLRFHRPTNWFYAICVVLIPFRLFLETKRISIILIAVICDPIRFTCVLAL